MHFPLIESAIATCGRHIDGLPEDDPDAIEIENRLVSSLVVLLASELEQFIELCFCRRADVSGDPEVTSYVRNTMSRSFRSPDLGKINQTLAFFSRDYRDRFRREVENSPSHAAWDNIMKARHAVVHRQGSMNLTFREFRDAYPMIQDIVDRLLEVLGLEDTEWTSA